MAKSFVCFMVATTTIAFLFVTGTCARSFDVSGKIREHLQNTGIGFVGEADGKQYFTDLNASQKGVDFFTAIEFCHKNKLFPATITSKAQNDAVINGLGEYGPFWLPFTDIGSEGKFRWVRSLSEISFNNWLPGHPASSDEAGRWQRNCAYVYPAHNNDGSWLNLPCAQENLTFRPLCEYP